MKWRLLLLIMVMAFSACTDEGPISTGGHAGYKGKITVVVSVPNRNGYENKTFVYDLNADILELKARTDSPEGKVAIQPFATGAIDCSSSPRLKSPDGKFVAHCEVPAGARWNSMVFEDASGKEVSRQGAGYHRQVVGCAWAPDSRSIAIATAYKGMSFYPSDLIAAIGGHPVPVYDFNVELMKVDPQDLANLPDIQEEFRLGVCNLAGWQ